jgi:hypothetical protein
MMVAKAFAVYVGQHHLAQRTARREAELRARARKVRTDR